MMHLCRFRKIVVVMLMVAVSVGAARADSWTPFTHVKTIYFYPAANMNYVEIADAADVSNETCTDQYIFVLRTGDPGYKDVISAMITAQATGRKIYLSVGNPISGVRCSVTGLQLWQ